VAGVQWRVAPWEDRACLTTRVLIDTRSVVVASVVVDSTTSTRTLLVVSALSHYITWSKRTHASKPLYPRNYDRITDT